MKKKLHQSKNLAVNSGVNIELTGKNKMCPVCTSTQKLREIYSFPPFNLVECAKCQTIHLSPRPTPEILSQIYNNNYYKDLNQEHGYLDYAAEAKRISLTYRRRLSYIKPYVDMLTEPKVLEIGSALGFGLPEALRLFGGDIQACDISQEAVFACQKLGFRTNLTDEYGICSDIEYQSLDMVYAFDVIEHLPDIRRLTVWVNEILKPGGFFFITTPDMDHILNRMLGSRSPSIKIPQHIVYFSTSTLQNALSPFFKLKAQQWDYQYVSLSMLLSRFAHIMHFSPIEGSYGPTIPVPNGMRMYIFQKECAQ